MASSRSVRAFSTFLRTVSRLTMAPPQPSDGLHVRDPVFLQLLGQTMDPLGGGVGIGGQGG